MSAENLWIPILIPLAAALFSFLLPSRIKGVRETVSLLGAGALFVVAWIFFGRGEVFYRLFWAGLGMDFELRLYSFSAFILLALSGFVFLITLYSLNKMAGHPRIREYYGYLFLTAALSVGAVLANNLILLVFFWEGLLLTLYAMISLGGKQAHRTAVKSFIISGFCDFAMILGIAILWSLTGTLRMSDISVVPTGLAAVSFILMMIGAIGKAGAMPFHTWIPDAAVDAPVTVMAYIPAALEKLLGIYLLARIALDFFVLKMNHPLCITMMAIGALTIVLAVFMALVQKDFKRLLSYHAVSQVGYMILGIGTGVPVGIAGGVFHMVNHAMYKCGLFLSAGSVEKQAGTTELKKLGGLYKEMPLTAFSFAVCAAAISGIWPLNGFVSKEMVFHGSLETGYRIFAAAAWAGAILTFASFLKAGHSVFFGKRSADIPPVKESSASIVLPMLTLSGLCIFFGVGNAVPLKLFIQPLVKAELHTGAHALSLMTPVAWISLGCLVLAFFLHFYGYRRNDRKPYLASEPIHHFPGFFTLYNLAEARIFDIYEQGMIFLQNLSRFLFRAVDRPIDFLYETGVPGTGKWIIRKLRQAHNGLFANYLAWLVGGLLLIAWFMRHLFQ